MQLLKGLSIIYCPTEKANREKIIVWQVLSYPLVGSPSLCRGFLSFSLFFWVWKKIGSKTLTDRVVKQFNWCSNLVSSCIGFRPSFDIRCQPHEIWVSNNASNVQHILCVFPFCEEATGNSTVPLHYIITIKSTTTTTSLSSRRRQQLRSNCIFWENSLEIVFFVLTRQILQTKQKWGLLHQYSWPWW